MKVRGALRGLLLADIGHQDDTVGRHSSLLSLIQSDVPRWTSAWRVALRVTGPARGGGPVVSNGTDSTMSCFRDGSWCFWHLARFDDVWLLFPSVCRALCGRQKKKAVSD